MILRYGIIPYTNVQNYQFYQGLCLACIVVFQPWSMIRHKSVKIHIYVRCTPLSHPLVYSVLQCFPTFSVYQSFVLLEVNPLCLISILFINFTLLVIIFNKINCSLLISENLISITTIYSGGVLANNSIAFANYSRWTKMLR